jgi:hypothetical protein
MGLGRTVEPIAADEPYCRRVDVFLLWHVRHAPFVDRRPTRHRAEEGQLTWDEEDGDDLKILGVYSTEQKARDRIVRARSLPGFRDEPDCFLIDHYAIDQDRWIDGFVSVPDVG